jgi:hypothetical protein
MVHSWWDEMLSIPNHHGILLYAESKSRYASTERLISRSPVNRMDLYESILTLTTPSLCEQTGLGIHMSWVAWDTFHSIYGETTQLQNTIYLAPIKPGQIRVLSFAVIVKWLHTQCVQETAAKNRFVDDWLQISMYSYEVSPIAIVSQMRAHCPDDIVNAVGS